MNHYLFDDNDNSLPTDFSFDNMKSPRSRGSVDGNMDVSKYSATKLETGMENWPGICA